MPNMPDADSAWIRFAPVSVRERKIRSGTSGLAAVASRTMKPARRTSVTAPNTTVRGAVQPSSAAGLTMVNTPTISAAVISTAPGTSVPRPSPRPLSFSISLTASTVVSTPIGRLTKKIQCQLIAWVRTPPASRPIEPPADATKAYMPIALACSRGSGNSVTIMPRITAEVSAPPTPWMNRAITSTSWDPASPHSTEAAVKTISPATKMFRRPSRSPRRPASRSRPPNAIR